MHSDPDKISEQTLAQAKADQSYKVAVARLETINEEVDNLERLTRVLDMGGVGYDYARITYHCSLEGYDEVSSEQGRSSIKAAIGKGEAYIQHLQKRLGIDGSGLSSLELEKQKLREAIQRDSPYGRTGSHRGYGAGALKPGARHLNSNRGTAPAQPAKTEKKAKKPALGR
ncbi:hypothetical protein LTR17_010791 [Elasticomyces elasticus]|nr:hypothetical protein LTR17_010791 [Elasticomyces elasticus]